MKISLDLDDIEIYEWQQSVDSLIKEILKEELAKEVKKLLRNKNKEINKLLTAAAENKIKELEDSLKLQSEGVEL